MFRAEILIIENVPTLKLEGRLVGDWAKEAKSLVTERSIPKGLIIDITEVTCIDQEGEQTLIWLRSIGATFEANNVYVASVCERLGLPLRNKASHPANGRGGRGTAETTAARERHAAELSKRE